MAIKRKCICCGKEYEYCPNCHKELKPLWMASFDCETCKDLFNIVSAYNVGMVDKNKVKDFVRAKGLNTSGYSESIRKVLEDNPIKASRDGTNETAEKEDGFVHYISRRRRRK